MSASARIFLGSRSPTPSGPYRVRSEHAADGGPRGPPAARGAPESAGKLIVSVVCDFGERYLSNPVYAELPEPDFSGRKPGIAAQRVEARVGRQEYQPIRAFIEGALQPLDCLIPLPKAEVNRRDVDGGDVRTRLESGQEPPLASGAEADQNALEVAVH